MKRCFNVFAAAVACGLVLSGCAKKADELVVWESLNGPDKFIEQAAVAYKNLHPELKTEIKFVNVEVGDATNKIALDGPGGVGPDVFCAPHDNLGRLVSGGHVLPTENPDAVASLVLPVCARAATYSGTMYGYPVSAETYALFYNKALISEAELPSTWEALAEWVKGFSAEHPDKYGFVMDVGNAYYTIIFTTADGNRLFGPDGDDASNSYLNTPAAVEGMKFFQSLRGAVNVPSADMSTDTVDEAFAAGNAAMHITGLWNVKKFEEAGVDFGIAPLPCLPGSDVPAASFSGTRVMFVSAYTEKSELANDFAAFCVSPDMQKLRFELTGALPSLSIKVESPYMPGFQKQMEYAFPMPSIPSMDVFWDAMNNASKNIWDGADVKRELDACNATILGL